MEHGILQYHYVFRLEDGQSKEFVINLDDRTLALIASPGADLPVWARLENSKCVNCPLQGVEYCPIAVNFAGVVEAFTDLQSHMHATIFVESPHRTYAKATSIQQGLSSIFGIYMVTSGCPIMDQLRPNVAFHLPFATPSETASRTIGMYLTAQFFRAKHGMTADWSLDGLVFLYSQISHVNRGMSRRLLTTTHSDAGVNAIAILHAFGDMLRDGAIDYLNQIEVYYQSLVNVGSQTGGSP